MADYFHNPVHRNGTPGKSQWTIPIDDEVRTFRRAEASGWLDGAVAWGLHLSRDQPQYLGFARDHVARRFVAKFVADGNASVWHGYPADHQADNSDIPARAVIAEWLKGKVLSAAKLRKLTKGQPCSL